MTVERYLRGIAGFFILLSVGLAVKFSQGWLYFTEFVGINLFQSAFTNWCPLISMLQMAGMKTSKQQIEALRQPGAVDKA